MTRAALLRYFCAHFQLVRETMIKSAATINGSFDPTHQVENLEIHKVFLRFPMLGLCQNISLSEIRFSELALFPDSQVGVGGVLKIQLSPATEPWA